MLSMWTVSAATTGHSSVPSRWSRETSRPSPGGGSTRPPAVVSSSCGTRTPSRRPPRTTSALSSTARATAETVRECLFRPKPISACRRGSAEFVSGKYSLLDEVPRTNCLAAATRCGPEHSCLLIGSQQTCCPTTGRLSATRRRGGFQPASAAPREDDSTRASRWKISIGEC